MPNPPLESPLLSSEILDFTRVLILRTRFPLPALALGRKAQTRKSKRQEEPRVTATVVRTLLVFRSRLRVLCVLLCCGPKMVPK